MLIQKPTAVLLAALFVACGGAGQTTTTLDSTTAEIVAEIQASTDCDWLQLQFDAFAGAHDRGERRAVVWMQAADDRMEAIGC